MGALFLGVIGARGDFFDRLYTALQLFVLNYQSTPGQSGVSVPLQIARFLAPVVAAYATIRVVAALFDEHLQELRVWFRRDHIVVCGLGIQGQELVKSFLDEKLFRNFLNQPVGVRGMLPVVVIEVDRANPATRDARDAGANVLFGDATNPDVLRRARVDRARFLFAVSGQDGVNAEIAARVLELTTGRKRPLEMFVHLDPKLCGLIVDRPRRKATTLEFFNVHERAARTLLEEHPAFSNGVAGRAHILLLGSGQLGSALAVRIAGEWRDRARPNGASLRLSLVDLAADAKADALREREPALEQDCEFVPYQVDVESPAFEHVLARGEVSSVDIAYVCFGDDTRSLRTSLLLRHWLPASRVVARMTSESRGLATLLVNHVQPTRETKIVPFSLAKSGTRIAVAFASRRGELARQLHQTYLGQGVRGPYAVSWEELPDEIKESNLRQADQITGHLEEAGFRLRRLDRRAFVSDFHPEEIEKMARLEHGRWSHEKREQGWNYAPERDDKRKLHPGLIEWADLPDARKEINRNFVRSWLAMLRRAGIQVVRG